MKTKLFENINGNQFKLSEDGYDETDMKNPEEKREVQIARAIQRYAMEIHDRADLDELKSKIIELTQELLVIHGIDLEKRL